MKAALIGTTKIAEIHLRELIENGCKEITIISRDKSKADKLISKFKFYENIKFISSHIKILKIKKFNLIDICSNTNFHLKHLYFIPKFSGVIIVEKPIFSITKNKKNFRENLNKIYKKHKKIFVCYPMIYFAKTIHKFLDLKKINNFRVNYHTSGKHFYNEIGLDLLPHAISITSELFKDFDFNNKNIITKKIISEKNKWSSKIIYNDIKILYNFSQNKKRKVSKFSLNLNEKKLVRYTKKINNIFQNYIQFNNKMVSIDNPMKIMFKDFFENKNKISFFKKNNNFTYFVMSKIQNLI